MNVLIVEDELHTARLLQELIEQEGDFMVVETLESVVETVQYLSKYQQNIDLLFLDIQLADGKSFELFKHLDVVVPIVFCTAYDAYTLQAIKHNGIDYILKPFKDEDVRQALKKYKNLLSRFQHKNRLPTSFTFVPEPAYQQNFLTQFREKSIVKKVEEIALFCVEHEQVYFYTFKGEKFPLLKKMEYVASVCDPAMFFRINRQMLVNRGAIRSFEPYFHRKIILNLSFTLTEKVIVSRLKVSDFKVWLER